MIELKPVKVMVITPGYRFRKGVLIREEGPNLYRVKMLEGPPETYRGQPIFITELTLAREDFIIIEGLGEVLYE